MKRRCIAIVAAALVSTSVGASACGVPIDNEPRSITQTTIEPTESAPTTIPGPEAQEVSVYFLRGDQLERQGYGVGDQPSPDKALTFVLAGPTEDADPDLGTAIPPDTALLSVVVSNGVATIDLTGEINDVTGPTQKEAFAQIVFTILAFESVESVRFAIDGTPIDAPTDDGNLPEVTADNYDKPLNPR